MNDHYDVFISYRREGGQNHARTIQQALEKKYRVFLDFDELNDGVLDQRIKDAISHSSVFLLLLTKGALDRCSNEDDWVRKEILYASECSCHIVPVTIDDPFDGYPSDLPKEIQDIVGAHQFSELQTRKLFKPSMKLLIRDRIEPYVRHEDDQSGAEIHIEVDADCNLYRYKDKIATLQIGKDNIVRLVHGKHKLIFESNEFPEIKEQIMYSVPSDNFSDIITFSINNKIEAKRKEEKDDKKRIIIEEIEKKASELSVSGQKEEAIAEYNKLIPIYKKSADEGDVSALYELGYVFDSMENWSQAFKWYEKAAEQGHVDAQWKLGDIYGDKWSDEWRKKVPQDKKKAAMWYRKAAEQGNAELQWKLGNKFLFGESVPIDEFEARKWWRKGAEQGNAEMQFDLGIKLMLTKDLFFIKRKKEAFKWFKKAAEQGQILAQFQIGLMYIDGKGCKRNITEGISWLSMAAKQGFRTAQLKLGEFFENGEIVPKDDLEAFEWYKMAAEQGYADAQYHLGLMCLTCEGIVPNYTEAKTEAAKWFKMAAEQGHAVSQDQLGCMYENGWGVNQSDTEAVKWYRKAAEQGNADAQRHLGYMYENGWGVDQNYIEAVKWYRKAAEQGDALAIKSIEKISKNNGAID